MKSGRVEKLHLKFCKSPKHVLSAAHVNTSVKHINVHVNKSIIAMVAAGSTITDIPKANTILASPDGRRRDSLVQRALSTPLHEDEVVARVEQHVHKEGQKDDNMPAAPVDAENPY